MVHYRYWIGILIACLGLVTATAWFKNNELVVLVNFAATISSLILAILAIIITTNSNKDVFSAISSLNNSADRVAFSATQLEAAKSQLLDQASGIPEALSQMGERIDRAQEWWAGTSSRGVSEAVKSSVENEKVETITLKVDAEDLLKAASPGGLIAIYIATLAAEKGTSFNPEDFQNPVPSNYSKGYMYALMNTGVIQGSYSNKNYTIKSTHPFTSEMLKAVMSIKGRASNPYVQKQRELVEKHFLVD